MSNIELIIKIPKELYEAYKNKLPMLGDTGMDIIAQSIANGTPLPKGHGKLKDADALLKQSYCIDDSATLSTRNVVDEEDIEDAPTIIKADTAESEI